MAAGLGFKTFAVGEVLTAADTNGYLMQGVLVFASAAARDAAITSPQEGQFAYLKDTNVTTYYTGSAWANLDTTGMTNPMTTTGDMVYSSSGSTPARLGIGSTGNVLTVAGGVPTWAAPTGSSSSFSLLATQAVTTGSSYQITGLSGYNTLQIILTGLSSTAGSVSYTATLNNDTASNYIIGMSGYVDTQLGNFGGSNANIQLGKQGDNAANGFSGGFTVLGANTTAKKVGMVAAGGNSSNSTSGSRWGAFSYDSTSVISSVEIKTSGTFDAGTIYVYGSAV